MALGRGNSGGGTFGTQNLSVAVDAGSQSNRFLEVDIVIYSSSDLYTSATYAGVAVDYVQKGQGVQNTGNYLYKLGFKAPASGSNTLVVNFSSNPGGPSWGYQVYTDAHQTTQFDVQVQRNQASSTSFAPTLTTITNGCFITLGYRMPSGNFTAGANTQLLSVGWAGAGSGDQIADTPTTQTVGLQTLNITTSGAASGWDGLLATILPVAAVGPTNVKTWDGLALASVKTVDGLAIASVKTINGLN